MKFRLLVLMLGYLPFLAFSQHIYTDYTIFFEGNDSTEIRYKFLTKNNIERLIPLLRKMEYNQRIITVKDSENRTFQSIIIKHDTLLVEQIVGGYYRLYAGKTSDLYLQSDSNTYLLDKEIVLHQSREMPRYKSTLLKVTTGLPGFTNRVNELEFAENEISEVAYDMNAVANSPGNYKKGRIAKKRFVGINLHGGYGVNIRRWRPGYTRSFSGEKDNTITDGRNRRYVGFDVYNIVYYPGFSPNLSIRTGFTGGYYQSFFQGDIENAIYASLPVLGHAEFTNNVLTPYLTLGFAPHLWKIQRDKFYFTINWKAGTGLKVKVTDNWNLRAGLLYDIMGINYEAAIEYVFGPRF